MFSHRETVFPAHGVGTPGALPGVEVQGLSGLRPVHFLRAFGLRHSIFRDAEPLATSCLCWPCQLDFQPTLSTFLVF